MADDPGLDTDILAATLKQGLDEAEDLLEYLVRKFEGPLSSLLTVRRRGGLFAREKPVEELLLRFEERHFQISRAPQGFLTPSIQKSVRGIVLKSEKVSEDKWLRELAAELALHAERSVEGRAALARFVGVR